ncbi:MAG: hypothetical protein OEZ16_07070 [Chromatiales bacterium]|nr:hypothetical protein [Chromatiales bacterium]
MLFNKDDVLVALRRHIGEGNGATAAELVAEMTGSIGTDTVAERLLRAHVTSLREEGHHICAHPARGYFIAETDAELQATCEYLYDRAMTSLKQVAAMKRVSLPDLRGQLHLPT